MIPAPFPFRAPSAPPPQYPTRVDLLTPGVNRAIIELHRAGVLTSTTLMARAAATDEAIELARSTPSLGVGCHVLLWAGPPPPPPPSTPTLTNQKPGSSPAALTAFLARL